MAENGKKRMEAIYTALGIILISSTLLGGFWAIYAKPKIIEQNKIDIREWWDQSGCYMVDKIVDERLEKKLEKFEQRQEMIYQMNLMRLSAHERKKFEISDTTN